MLDLSALEQDTAAAPTGEALFVDIALISENPENPRTQFDLAKLQELSDDIATRGFLQPIIVRKAFDGKYIIMFGARRFRAAQLAKLVTVPVTVTSDERQLNSYAQVAENNQREPLTALEMAAFVQQRLAAGDSKTTIGKGLKVSPTLITFLSALIDPPALLLELYHSGKCTSPEHLYKIKNLVAKESELVELRLNETEEVTRAWLDRLSREVEQLGMSSVVILPNEPAKTEAMEVETEYRNADDDIEPPALTEQLKNTDKELVKEKNPSAVNYKIVMLTHDDRAAQLILKRRASTVGFGWIKYADDGSEVEILLSTATLDSLIE